jgi:hypothetical protein
MLTKWRRAYAKLKAFIAEHPEIEIGESVVSIPEGPRPQFYRLFDRVEATFINERFPDMLYKAERLGHSYISAEEEFLHSLKLDQFSTSTVLQKFLRNPERSLTEQPFDPLFDLLKGKIDAEAFEKEASARLEAYFRKSYRVGYEKWVEISLMKLLQPDRIFRVPLPEANYQQKMWPAIFPLKKEFPPESVRISSHGPTQMAAPLEREILIPTISTVVPPPEETKSVLLSREIFPVFITPDFIIHTGRTRQYVAIGSELSDALWEAANPSKGRKWYQLEISIKTQGSVGPKPDLAIYMDQRLENLSLIADKKCISRPDMIIECVEDGFGEKDLKKVKLQHKNLKPRLGTFVVSRRPVAKGARKGLGKGVRLLSVGLSRSKLSPIVDSLVRSGRASRRQ